VIFVQKVFVQRHQVQLVEKLEVRSRYSRHVRNGLKLYFFMLSLVWLLNKESGCTNEQSQLYYFF
jgi:hypothetical protein